MSESYEQRECLFCAAEWLHENEETYTFLSVLDPSKVPPGEDHEDHLVEVPVCIAHYEVFEQYQRGANVEEIEPS